jgi:rhamnosyltransferase subunit B
MARVVITTFGSTGDLNPFIAIGLALRDRGHEVVFAVEANFEQQVNSLGFPVRVLTGDQAEALGPYRHQIFNSDQPLTSLKLLVDRYILPTLPAKVAELCEICRQADLLISVTPQFAASIVAEMLHIAWITVILTPSTLPSAQIAVQPMSVSLPTPLQRLSNRFSWLLGGLFLRRIVDRPVNRIRRAFSVSPAFNLMWTGNLSTRFTAMAVSPVLVPRPHDWPEYVHITGFCFWDGAEDWLFPETLKTFLHGGKPVVAVTAGTVSPDERALFAPYYQTSIESILACGARALLINPPEINVAPEQEEDVLSVTAAPFSQVFPLCAAVIHHGGIGTIAQCLRAGVPSLIVPGGMDQPFNAAQVVQRKAGLWIPRKRYTARRAESALKTLLSIPTYQEQARKIQAGIMQENGVSAICAAVEADHLWRHNSIEHL